MGQVPQLEKIWSGLVSLTKNSGPSPLHKVRALDELTEQCLLRATN